MRHAVFPLLFSIALLAACDESLPDEPTCQLIALSSATIRVHDSSGQPLPGATVTFRIDDGDWRAASCFPDRTSEDCAYFNTVFEVPGEFLVRVEKEGYLPAQIDFLVPMSEDGCHVLGKEVGVHLFSVDELE